ncbi:S1C family serine protease [Pseudorhizobium flavum]|uniref:S1C family serine protease n=1 Tax=Pseudorhizobium flavum TaxID=1335061 RepID=UPI0037702BE1
MRYLITSLLAMCLGVVQASAQDDQCIFAANAPAVAYVEYSFDTTEGRGRNKGTAFIISQSGFAITNAHVVSPPKGSAEVKSATVQARVGGLLNPFVPVEVLFRDPSLDLALLKLQPPADGDGWPTVTIGARTLLPIGAPLLAIGYSTGDVSLVRDGAKTANNTFIDGELVPWWQTDLPITSGNSGGPIIDKLGTVVGVAVAKSTSSEKITYIIPIALTRHLLDAAGVVTQDFGKCARFPACRHASHGVESHTISESQSAWGEWRDGGYNQTAACNDFLNELRTRYPNSSFEFVRSDERSRDTGFRHFQYRYYCEYIRKENPVYNLMESEACLQ